MKELKNFKIEIEYDGSNYHGWQRQPCVITIQEVVENALLKITGQGVNVIASGRTDAGVHAKGQVASFKCDTSISPASFKRALNSLFPRDIVVTDICIMPFNFNARYSAISKCYRYSILNRDYPSSLLYKYSWFIPKRLDIAKMKSVINLFIGEKDFSSFMGAKSTAVSTVRHIIRLEIDRKEDIINITIEGNGFLKHMVRNIVGTLVSIGKGEIDPSTLEEIIKLRDRRKAGPSAPAHGLCLMYVRY